jgi:hypothetical protein
VLGRPLVNQWRASITNSPKRPVQGGGEFVTRPIIVRRSTTK